VVLSNARWDIPLLRAGIKASQVEIVSEGDIIKHLPKYLNLNHLMALEGNLSKKGVEWAGFHLDRYGILSKSKIIQFRKLELLQNGFYKGVPGVCGVFKGGFSTFFPRNGL
jgi:hypothetical protein